MESIHPCTAEPQKSVNIVIYPSTRANLLIALTHPNEKDAGMFHNLEHLAACASQVA